MKPITESNIETFAIETLESLGWDYVYGLKIAPGAETAERESFEQVILTGRLRKQLAVINPGIPEAAREQALQKVLRLYSPDLISNNEEFHQFLVEKIRIPYQQDGYQRSHEVALIDFDNIENNEFLIVNQFTIVENNQNKRPDILLFVNGLPLVVIELKNAADEKATVRSAFEQIQTYKAIIPRLFNYNAVCVISDGMECKAGSLSADFSRFMAWKTVDGKKEASRFIPQLETLIKGMLNRATLLDLVRNFIVFEKIQKGRPEDRHHHHRNRKEARRLSSIPRRQRGSEKHPASRVGNGESQRRRRLAHAGQRQIALDGLLHGQAGLEFEQSDRRRHHRPQRLGRAIVRHVRRFKTTAAAGTRAGGKPRTSQRIVESGERRNRFHDDSKVHARSRKLRIRRDCRTEQTSSSSQTKPTARNTDSRRKSET